jgi:hypothetical protein
VSELYNFLKKTTSHLNSVSYRSIYGLDSVFTKDKAFLLVTKDNRIAIYIENEIFFKKRIESVKLDELTIDNKVMDHWFLVPETFNKKKNKLIPLIDSAHEALFIKNKRNNKKNKSKQMRKKAAKKPANTDTQSSLVNEGIITKVLKLFKS